jgi:hypothetical protein
MQPTKDTLLAAGAAAVAPLFGEHVSECRVLRNGAKWQASKSVDSDTHPRPTTGATDAAGAAGAKPRGGGGPAAPGDDGCGAGVDLAAAGVKWGRTGGCWREVGAD